MDRSCVCRIACIQFNTHLPQCTPSTDTSHMAQLALCACVGHGAANVVFLDRHGIGPGLGFFPRSLLRVPPETGPGLVSLSFFIGTLCATCTLVLCTLSVPCLRYTHITSIAIVYSRFTSIAIYEVPNRKLRTCNYNFLRYRI